MGKSLLEWLKNHTAASTRSRIQGFSGPSPHSHCANSSFFHSNTMTALHHIPNRTKHFPPLRVGIGGPVGSGKATLLEMLAPQRPASHP
jgi:pantothenate kinase